MMGPGHALSGLGAGLALGRAAGLGPAQCFVAAILCAGAALLPDIDNPSATVSRVFGPFSQWYSRGVNNGSAAIYDMTKTARDNDRDGGHRGVTHTWPFALAIGASASVGAQMRLGMLAILFLCLSLALRGLLADAARKWGWLLTTAVSAALTAVAAIWLPPTPGWVGLAMGVGCIVHCWGDSLTLMGCPWMWPIKIKGKRWYDIATPAFLRFRAGGKVETWAVTPVLTLGVYALCINTFPGGWDWVASLG